jgi:hypothetical protein
MTEDDSLSADLAYVRVVLDALAKEWARFGRPLPKAVAPALAILDRATWAMSLQRQGFGSDETESDSEKLGSREVAELLGVTRRTVQRRAESMGGQQVSGSWVFDRDDIGLNDG